MGDFFDRFSDSAGPLSSHVADSGDTWDSDASGWSLSGTGSVYSSQSSPTNGTPALSTWTPSGTDYAATIVLGASAGSDGSIDYGIIVRGGGSSGSKTYYVAFLDMPPTYRLSIYRVDSGVAATALGSTTTLNTIPAPDDCFTLAVSGTGATVTLTAYQNGAQLLQVADSSGSRITASGTVGLWSTGFSPTLVDGIRALWAGATGGPSGGISPASSVLLIGGTKTFNATGVLPNDMPQWRALSGSVTPASGLATSYTTPGSGSSDTVTWISANLPTQNSSASITLMSPNPTPTPAPVAPSVPGGAPAPMILGTRRIRRRPRRVLIDMPLPDLGKKKE
jgi:hypothetical protein